MSTNSGSTTDKEPPRPARVSAVITLFGGLTFVILFWASMVIWHPGGIAFMTFFVANLTLTTWITTLLFLVYLDRYMPSSIQRRKMRRSFKFSRTIALSFTAVTIVICAFLATVYLTSGHTKQPTPPTQRSIRLTYPV